jgi:hypothetical protein
MAASRRFLRSHDGTFKTGISRSVDHLGARKGASGISGVIAPAAGRVACLTLSMHRREPMRLVQQIGITRVYVGVSPPLRPDPKSALRASAKHPSAVGGFRARVPRPQARRRRCAGGLDHIDAPNRNRGSTAGASRRASPAPQRGRHAHPVPCEGRSHCRTPLAHNAPKVGKSLCNETGERLERSQTASILANM